MELKLIKSKKLPPVGIKPRTLGNIVSHSNAFLTEITWQLLVEGYSASLLLHKLNFGLI